MKILIKPNLNKVNAEKCALSAVTILNDIAEDLGRDINIFFDKKDESSIKSHKNVIFGTYRDMLKACDLIMPIGGDGTIMRAARTAAQAGKPILSINAGRVGFLTQVEINELNELRRIFTGEYTILNRMMLEAEIANDGVSKKFTALNDVVIRHGDADRIVEIDVRQNDCFVSTFRADGVIFSTPTGSTAYSMSAGGPIVTPELELILMTAICPHSAFNSSMVLPSERSYIVHERNASSHTMYVSLDGVRVGKLTPKGSVTVRRSGTIAKFIDLGLRDFFSNLNQKLSWR